MWHIREPVLSTAHQAFMLGEEFVIIVKDVLIVRQRGVIDASWGT